MKNGSTIGLIFTGLIVLAGGVAAGYYFIGGRSDVGDGSGSGSSVQSAPAPGSGGDSDSAPPPAAPAPVKHIASIAGQFTAPGAPTIDITETKVTALKPQAAPVPAPPKPTDTEASQAGTNSDAGNTSSTSGSTTSDDSTTDSTSSSTPSSSNAATSGAGATDSTSGSTDSASGNAQQSDSGAQAGDNSGTAGSAGGGSLGSNGAAPASTVLYHVVAGVVHSESNAKSLESALRQKGYTATILHQSGSGGDTYTVQIGAYSSQVTADEMVASLQHDGFPASVSAGN